MGALIPQKRTWAEFDAYFQAVTGCSIFVLKTGSVLPVFPCSQKRTWAEFDAYFQAAGLDDLVQYTAKRRYDEHCQVRIGRVLLYLIPS